MQDLHINMTAVLIAVVANFILGALWYMPLFGKAWAKEMGMDMTQKPAASMMIRNMSIMVIGNFLFAYVFAHNMAAWTYVPGMETMSASKSAGMAAFFTWMGFYLPMDIGKVTWEMKSWKLFFIDTGYHFLMLIVVAMILANM